MKLYFENSYGERRIIAEPKKEGYNEHRNHRRRCNR